MPHFHDVSDELRDLNTRERRVILLTLLGAFFIGFDFIIYFFFNDAIKQAFFPKTLPAFWQSMGFLLLLMTGYLSRPLGGILLADYGDKHGRKPVMLLSLLIVSISTLLIAFLPTHQQVGIWSLILLLVLRFFQGVGIGAEATASWVYLTEHMPRRHIGSVCGMLIGAFILSALFCNILNTLFVSMLTPRQFQTFGWRLPFFLGAVGTFITIFLRYQLHETPIWLAAKRQGKLLTKLPLSFALQKHLYGILMTFSLSWFTSSIYLIVFLMMPSLSVHYFDLDSNLISIANGIALFFAAIGAIIFGYFADRFNSGRVFSFGCVMLAVSGWLFFFTLRDNNELILLTYALFGFFSGVIGMVPSVCVRLFPVQVRLSGVSFSYNTAYALTGAFAPLLLNHFSQKLALTPVLYLTFLCVVGVILGFFLTNLHGLYRIETHPEHDKPVML